MSFGKIFSMFWKYWDYTSKRGTDCSTLEVLLLTNVFFMDLRTRWGKERLGCGRVKVDLCGFRS